MSLQDIKNKLYRKEEENGSSEKLASWKKNENGDEIFLKEKWEKSEGGLSEKTKKIVKISGIFSLSVFFLLGIFYFILEYRKNSFSLDNIVLSWDGPKEISSGESANYILSWENRNRSDLENVNLKIKIPSNFILEKEDSFEKKEGDFLFFDLGKIEGKASGKIEVSGKMYSPKGAFIYLKAGLNFKPENISSSFSKENQIGIMSISSPLKFEVSAPQGVSDGGLVRYEVSFENNQEFNFSDLTIKASYPRGFSFSKSTLETFDDGRSWFLGGLESFQEGVLIVEGKLEGVGDDVKKTHFSIGNFYEGEFVPLNDAQASTKIISSPLSIKQRINKSEEVKNIKRNESIEFEIIFKNEGTVGLRDVVITEYLEGEALDFTTLELKGGGDYDEKKHKIVWRASEYPILKNLSPGQEGVIGFAIKTKEKLPIKNKEDKNFVIKSLAQIDSPDIPTIIDENKIVSSNLFTIKVSSPIYLRTLGYFYDDVFKNSGPLPPKVGEETSYALHWEVSSLSNDLKDVRVEAFLPSGVEFLNLFSPIDEKIEYNSRTNKIVWKIGKISAGTGIIKNPKKIAFKVKINPSIEQVGKTVDLIKEPTLFARDEFTEEDISLKSSGENTEIKNDKKAGFNIERVIK